MSDNPDSVIRYQKFEDLMQRYKGQMENALYAAEQACAYKDSYCCDAEVCAFLENHGCVCTLMRLRKLIGDHIPQHDIEIPDNSIQADLKAIRKTLEEKGFKHTDTMILKCARHTE
jgi:membrane-bound lytic murein transglycosylase MltF